MKDYILEIKNLHTGFRSQDGKRVNPVLNGVNIEAERGKILGIVGESGSGKSVTMLSLMRLLGPNGVTEGEILFNGTDINKISEKEMRNIRGRKISMIFQDPMTALNPVYTVGNQIKEMIRLHRPEVKDPEEYAIELFKQVGIADGKRRLRQYPHEMSGGMRQRVVIAMALSSNPEMLIADEPTTALDVTVQAQILELIKNLTKERKMTTVIITHDLGVVAGLCDSVVVLYGGRVCEKGNVHEIFKESRHEYTKGLIAAVPGATKSKRLIPIEGTPVNRETMPDGCAFCARCKHAMEICRDELPVMKSFTDTHEAACWMNELPEDFNPFEKEDCHD